MSKKHYEAVAALLRSYSPVEDPDPSVSPDWSEGHEACRIALARDLASFFAEDNPRFDRARFLTTVLSSKVYAWDLTR